MNIRKLTKASLLLIFALAVLLSGCNLRQVLIEEVDIKPLNTKEEKQDNEQPQTLDIKPPAETVESRQNGISYAINIDERNTDFFQYLGMSFEGIEAQLGTGEESSELQYELGYLVYKFGDSSYRFMLLCDDGEKVAAETTCETMAVPLKEIIMSGNRTRIPKNELEQVFSIRQWDDIARWIDEDDGHDAPWYNVYVINGDYCGYYFNVYLEANEENKNSMPADSYFYFFHAKGE